jgi:hypothetical protein
MLGMTIFSDEARVQLAGYVNSQNINIWLEENPYAAHETLLHPVRIGVWCAGLTIGYLSSFSLKTQLI